MTTEEVHLLGLPLLNADFVAHRVNDVLAVWMDLEASDGGTCSVRFLCIEKKEK